MQRTPIVLGLLGAIALAGSSHAAVPSSVFGKWIEHFADGNGMVTEFTAASISSYPIDRRGRATSAPTAMPVTYTDLGGEIVGVSFNGGGGAMLARRTDDAITMALPGIGSHELTRLPPDDAGQSVG